MVHSGFQCTPTLCRPTNTALVWCYFGSNGIGLSKVKTKALKSLCRLWLQIFSA